MAGAGGVGSVKNTAARRVRLPSRISHRAERLVFCCGVVCLSMPLFLPQGGCPTLSDVIGTARTGAYV